jgi:hypothetical protein
MPTPRIAPAPPAASPFTRKLQALTGPSSESLLDVVIGPTPQCYSIRHMVNLFAWGAEEADVRHLSECDPCADWANNEAHSSTGLAAQRESARHRGLLDRLRFWSQPVPPPSVRVLLFVRGSLMRVASDRLSMNVALLAGVEGADRLDVRSLRLEGPLSSSHATLTEEQIGGRPCPVIRFDDVRMTDALVLDTNRHRTVVERVRLTGRFTADKHLTLSGQANVSVGEAVRGS